MDTCNANDCFARDGFQRLYVRTPLLESYPMSQITGCNVYLKMESMQPTASFKLRGIGYMIQKARQKGCKMMVCPSGGNGGLAAAYSGRKLNMPITIVVPMTTPQRMVERIRGEGATVIQQGSVWDESDKVAKKMAESSDCEYITPFDHPDIWEGHSSMMREIQDDLGDIKPDLVVVAVGGGGLLCGVATGMEYVGWKDVPILAMETNGADCFNAAVNAGKIVTLPAITSLAKCLGALTVAKGAYDLYLKRTIISEVVPDKEAVEAMIAFLDDQRQLVEPACGAALAAVYAGTIRKLQTEKKLPATLQNIVIIVCGGFSVSAAQLSAWKEEVGIN